MFSVCQSNSAFVFPYKKVLWSRLSTKRIRNISLQLDANKEKSQLINSHKFKQKEQTVRKLLSRFG